MRSSFGRSLFFDASLSPDRKFSCASCHLPDKFFTDGRARGMGRSRLKRNTLGQFKVPSLRNVALSAPSLHAGSHPSLRTVVEHYNDIDVERLHADGERILRPLKLSAADVDAPVVFLGTLNAALLDATRDDALDCP